MKFIGMFENLGILPQFSNKRALRGRAVLVESTCETADSSACPRAAVVCSKLLFGILITGMLFLGQASAQERPAIAEATHFGWADVLRVDPVYDTNVQAPSYEDCYEEQVIESASTEADNGKRTGATVLGAIIGGLIGNRFGKGDGRKAATAAGAVAGGVVGNNLGSGQPGNGPKYTTRRRCPGDDAAKNSRRVVAYDVEYRYRGEVYSSRMTTDPGDRMRVRINVTPAE